MTSSTCDPRSFLIKSSQLVHVKNQKSKIIIRAIVLVAAAGVLATVAGLHYLHKHIPAEIIPDIRAAIAARHIADPNARLARYLERLYGPLDKPANRERAFKDFFNANHIKAMQLIVKHAPPGQRRANIQAMAQWISNYQQTMSPDEKTALAAYFQSSAGQAALQAATAQFMQQDAVYRCETVPVITQLMSTLATVNK